MTEERITQVETPSGDTHTHTTVVTDAPRSGGGGGAMWVIVLLLVIVAAVAVFYVSGTSGSEVAKDNAVAEAAGDVGNAAQEVGTAAREAADSVTH
jgi:hypothetical protein